MKNVRAVVATIDAICVKPQNGKALFLIFALVMSFLIAACSSSSDTTPTSDSTEEATQSSAVAQTTPDAIATEPGLEEFGLTMDELVVKIEAVEAVIAECMTEAGFEYYAVDFNTVREAMLADKALPGMDQREFKAAYGFGISTLYAEVDVPQLAPEFAPVRKGLGERNVEIWNALSPADQVAYNRTLLGENLDATFAFTIEAEDFERTGGCTRTAVESVFTEEELEEDYRNPRDIFDEQDPRMVEALKQYAECVQEAGYDYNHPEELEPDIEEQFEDITGGIPIGMLSEEAKADLTELQEEERAIAVASFDCESTYIHPVQEQIQGE